MFLNHLLQTHLVLVGPDTTDEPEIELLVPSRDLDKGWLLAMKEGASHFYFYSSAVATVFENGQAVERSTGRHDASRLYSTSHPAFMWRRMRAANP